MIEMQESEKVCWCTCYHRTNEKSRVILKLLHITQFEQFSCIICVYTQTNERTKYTSVTEWLNNSIIINQAMNMVHNFMGAHLDGLDNATLEKIVEADGSNAINARRILAVQDIDNVVYTMPALVYNADEASTRSTMRTDILNYLKQMKVSFITGEVDIEDDKAWNDYVAKVKEMGYDKLMEIEQAAYDRYAAGLK